MFGLNECKLVLIQRKRVLEAGFSWTLMLISLPRRTYRLVKRETWVIAFCLSLVKPGSATVSLSALEKDVDFLPMARSVVQLTTWGSVLFWQPPSSRSLTVLSEERDASPQKHWGGIRRLYAEGYGKARVTPDYGYMRY